ncbi:MAG TPA: CotY/CotZ family spore coat protein [Bacilli bacterium]|nr:CotY/CotZ family spore coat protein [Bacilli bacterium]
MTNDSCCMADILRNILTLQNSCENVTSCLNTCSSPILGNIQNCLCYNTRPITLYNCSGALWQFPYTIVNGEIVTGTSSVFKIEKVDECCATFRVLAPNTDTTSDLPYVSTDSFFTISLDCVCILKCLPDTLITCN